MVGIIGIIAFLTVLGLSLIITRLATIALSLTGLSHEAARFQARSAFTGTGFTTSESEKVVNHPVRRRIIMWLMILRSAGLLTIVLTLILSFVGNGTGTDRVYRLAWLAAGVVGLWLLSLSRWVDRGLEFVMRGVLSRWSDLDVKDYAGLLKLSGEYSVVELQVQQDDWLSGKPLSECDLPEEGITVLGIIRDDGSYVGAPRGNSKIYAGDTLIVYGRSRSLQELDRRSAGGQGDAAHAEAVQEQQEHLAEQSVREQRHDEKKAAQEHEEGSRSGRTESTAEDRPGES